MASAIAFDHHRAGAGEPLVLVHGIGSCREAFDPILPLLEPLHDVIALSLPGFGRTPANGIERTFYAQTDAVERALVEAGIERAHLVGNSMGGWIVAELAARGRALSTVALSPAGLATGRETAWTVGALGRSQLIAGRLLPAVDGLAANPAGRALLVGLVHARPWRVPPASAALAVRMFVGSTIFQETLRWTLGGWQPRGLDRIEGRFRVAWGTRDLVLPFRQAARWGRVVPGAEVLPLPGLGHLPMPDDPELVARTILEVTAGGATPSPAQPARARA